MRHIPKNHKIQKTMKKFYFLFLMTLLTSTVTMQAQTFSQMSEKKRNAELIKMARKVYQDPLFADFYEHHKGETIHEEGAQLITQLIQQLRGEC